MRKEPLDAGTIVSAAEDALRRYGPDKTTVLDVARLLGVSHGSVYRHFPSKAALREAVISRWLDRTRDQLAGTTGDPGQPAVERLRELLTTLFRVKWAKADEDPELFAAFLTLASEHSGTSAAHVAFLLEQIREIVTDGIDAGEFAPGEPDTIARAVFDGTSRFHDPRHAGDWRNPGIEAESAAVVSLLLDGIRAR
ncbi:TetR family transcriptional regulator [Amycolatopsis panacis]|uniref:TetR/AcrR family transcriptional regulator n=1 Tax=Amycolatopsis panacis TaxID=2340917 RepID=A0A419I7V0_9PSEU|nr:TetR family transcriptional regulator [Amycolatopsis panacis]RJQ87850.1 TetR/AcrR family transcriptional regulator [Amycolatopsis panacis]